MGSEFDLHRRGIFAASAPAQPTLVNQLHVNSSPSLKGNRLVRRSVSQQPSSICKSVDFLSHHGISRRTLLRAKQLADKNGTAAAQELIAFRGIEEVIYYRLLAISLDMPFVEASQISNLELPRVSPGLIVNKTTLVRAKINDTEIKTVVAPDVRQVEQLETMCANNEIRNSLVMTAPSILRQSILRQLDTELVNSTRNHLNLNQPSATAKRGASAWQGAALAFMLVVMVMAVITEPNATGFFIHLVFSSFFLMCMTSRLLALADFRQMDIVPINPTPDRDKPIFSIMVPLYDEARVVPDLIAALGKLKWPRSKLEIKMVCEADDAATIDALTALKLDSRFEIVIVPKSGPPTKPNALCYALAFTNGKYITIYDAEDRPHPEQLLEAHQAFERGAEQLACVQAPLVIANAARNRWTAMFHFEYAGLFYGLLPWLARRKAPILLGGTSNHFKRTALIDAGGWDPYNVTEDADLGLRLWRKGYRTDLISRHTLEDAPRDFATWLPQRTRWFKGWMQTWIVHMRRPNELRKHMSFSSFMITQILLTGTVVSALLHPLMLANAVYLSAIMVNGSATDWQLAIAALDWSVLAVSYFAFMVLCLRSTAEKSRRRLKFFILLTPLYWMAISAAAWRGLWQLITNPFHWEKTPHLPHEKEI